MAEMSTNQQAAVAARTLTTALTALGDALASGNLAGVLDAEPALSTALASVVAARSGLAPPVGRAQTLALALELTATRAALARCAALGAALEEFVRGSGLSSTAYDASGAGVAARVAPDLDRKA